MTTKILRSAVRGLGDGTFDAVVATFAAELAAWRAQEELVKAGTAKPYPAPTAHPLVMSALREDGTPDYELVDVMPVASHDPVALRSRKDLLMHEVMAAETAAMNEAHPPGFRRADAIRMRDVEKSDQDRRAAMIEEANAEPTQKARRAKLEGLEARVLAGRSGADAGVAATVAATNARTERIARHAAAQLEEIERLTSADAHLWAMKPFPKGDER